ncbi:MAG: HD domain-containing protein, partial [Acidobacteriota bacterium]
MIPQKHLQNIESWFERYVSRFKSPDRIYMQNIELKKDHTFRVCDEIIRLGKSLDLSPEDIRLAKTMALLHDVGRFEQYDQYQTFDDSKSENHAQLSLKVIKKEQVLKGIDSSTQKLITCAISYHNRAAVPSDETDRCLFFSRLLRDADKLDILYVVTEYYHHHSGPSNQSLELDLPDSPHISDKVYKDHIAGKIVEAKHVQNLNDFKLFQMAWIYDINFPLTYQLIKQRQYLEKIRDALPP